MLRRIEQETFYNLGTWALIEINLLLWELHIENKNKD